MCCEKRNLTIIRRISDYANDINMGVARNASRIPRHAHITEPASESRGYFLEIWSSSNALS